LIRFAERGRHWWSAKNEINASVPYPDITDLIYDEDEAMTPEAIVDKAFTYESALNSATCVDVGHTP
jgi:hypothetical protein